MIDAPLLVIQALLLPADARLSTRYHVVSVIDHLLLISSMTTENLYLLCFHLTQNLIYSDPMIRIVQAGRRHLGKTCRARRNQEAKITIIMLSEQAKNERWLTEACLVTGEIY